MNIGCRTALLAALAFSLCAAAPRLAFIPVEPRFAADADEYRRLWKADGPRIAAALETASGLRFPKTRIDAIISEGRPMTSYDGRTIRLRASYSRDYKKATLVHELGHRLAFTLPRRSGLDDHRLLYLFLHDAWTDLYGREFADRMVGTERRIGPAYAEAWDWALTMNRQERQAQLRALRQRSVTPQVAHRVASAGGAMSAVVNGRRVTCRAR